MLFLSCCIFWWSIRFEFFSWFCCYSNFWFLRKKMNHSSFWSSKLRKLLKFSCPFFSYNYGILFLLLITNSESFIFAIPNKFLTIFRLNCSKNRKEILTIASSSFRITIWGKLSHVFKLEAVIIQIGNRYFIVTWWTAMYDLVIFKPWFISW